MTKHETELSSVDQCCYCCMSTVDISSYNSYGLTYWLCPECAGAHFVECERFQGYKMVDFVCPVHGERMMPDMARFFVGLDLVNKKDGTRKNGPRVRLGVDWSKEVEELRKEYLE